MAKRFPLHPKHPERICWGCDRYCPKDSLGCGNGSGRTQHPAELLGDDWYLFGDWGLDVSEAALPASQPEPNVAEAVNGPDGAGQDTRPLSGG